MVNLAIQRLAHHISNSIMQQAEMQNLQCGVHDPRP